MEPLPVRDSTLFRTKCVVVNRLATAGEVMAEADRHEARYGDVGCYIVVQLPGSSLEQALLPDRLYEIFRSSGL